jgi:hypothetical protein
MNGGEKRKEGILFRNPIEIIIEFVFQDNQKEHNWYNFPVSYTVDTFKGLTPLVILLMMFLYREVDYFHIYNILYNILTNLTIVLLTTIGPNKRPF